jgi:hypothetical protein
LATELILSVQFLQGKLLLPRLTHRSLFRPDTLTYPTCGSKE